MDVGERERFPKWEEIERRLDSFDLNDFRNEVYMLLARHAPELPVVMAGKPKEVFLRELEELAEKRLLPAGATVESRFCDEAFPPCEEYDWADFRTDDPTPIRSIESATDSIMRCIEARWKFFVRLRELFDSVDGSASRDVLQQQASDAISEIIDFVAEITDCSGAWYGYAENAVQWLLDAKGLRNDKAKAFPEIALPFGSWGGVSDSLRKVSVNRVALEMLQRKFDGKYSKRGSADVAAGEYEQAGAEPETVTIYMSGEGIDGEIVKTVPYWTERIDAHDDWDEDDEGDLDDADEVDIEDDDLDLDDHDNDMIYPADDSCEAADGSEPLDGLQEMTTNLLREWDREPPNPTALKAAATKLLEYRSTTEGRHYQRASFISEFLNSLWPDETREMNMNDIPDDREGGVAYLGPRLQPEGDWPDEYREFMGRLLALAYFGGGKTLVAGLLESARALPE